MRGSARAWFTAFAIVEGVNHGMVSLEIDERFPDIADLDGAWRAGMAAFA